MIIWMWIFGVLTVLSAAGVVIAQKPLNSALWLVLTLFFVAVHFALMRADFLAVLQVLIYAGAIMVLVIFVIMLLGIETDVVASKRLAVGKYFAAIISCVFLWILFSSLNYGSGIAKQKAASDIYNEVHAREIGKVLFTEYVIPFQLVGFLLLAAVIGAVVLSLDPKRPLRPGRGLRAKQSSGNGRWANGSD